MRQVHENHLRHLPLPFHHRRSERNPLENAPKKRICVSEGRFGESRTRRAHKHPRPRSPQCFLLSLLGDLEVRSFGGGADFVAQQKMLPCVTNDSVLCNKGVDGCARRFAGVVSSLPFKRGNAEGKFALWKVVWYNGFQKR